MCFTNTYSVPVCRREVSLCKFGCVLIASLLKIYCAHLTNIRSLVVKLIENMRFPEVQWRIVSHSEMILQLTAY